MNIKCRHWIDLREVPGANVQKEQSYIRFRDIERIFFTETAHQEYKIFVAALGDKFLYNIVKTEHEAMTLTRGLIDDIENSAVVR